MYMHETWEIYYLCFQTTEKPKKNYPTHDLELATIIFALKIWRLFIWSIMWNLYKPQESEICINSKKIKHAAKKVVKIDEGL